MTVTQYIFGQKDHSERQITVTSDEPYKVNNQNVIPIGTLVVQEIAAPYGYLYDNGTANGPGKQQIIKNYGDKTSSEEIYNELEIDSLDSPNCQNLTLKKVADNDNRALGNVAFLITSKTTGEKHVAVTNADGIIRTEAPSNNGDVNVNDELLAKNEQGQWYITDESKLVSGNNIWFTGFSDQSIKVDAGTRNAAFPFDDYTIEEIPTSANYGYDMIKK